MDTEEQAINDLTSMIYGQETQGEAPAEEAPATSEEPKAEAKEPETDIKIDVAKLFAEQTKIIQEQARKLEEMTKKQEEAPQAPSEEEMMIEQARQKLGIDMQKQQELYKMAEKMKAQEELEAIVNTFKKEFPEVELKDMGEFAETNGLMDLLNSKDLNQWRVVAKAMRVVAKPVAKPDAITPTAQKGAETTVWDRMKKGEDVSDTEFGAALLKHSNAL